MLTNIDINKIYPHPNNPRKDLGDLTELAGSIKSKGILQNLTIVPMDPELFQKKIASKKAYPGDYTAIIGHRRLAAAKLAGLTEVPCSISNMDEKEQLATMLLENMQRNDLTLYEQAQGFQMMLDLGETVDDLADKTGLSKSTVKSRVKLLKFDPDKFKESVARGGTLQDYAEIDKIKDNKLRNSVLEKVGTSNFRYELQNAINKEKSAEEKAAFITELEAFAERVENSDGLRFVRSFYNYNKNDAQKPDDADTVKYYFVVATYDIKLFKETTQTEDEKTTSAAASKAQEEMKERRSRLDEISATAFRLRLDFVRNFTGAKKHATDIMAFAIQVLLQDGWNDLDVEMYTDMLGIEFDEDSDEELNFDTISEPFTASPERVLLLTAYCSESDSDQWKYYEYHNCEHKRSNGLDAIYDFLEKLGYEMSDEEQALRDGTHELYVK